MGFFAYSLPVLPAIESGTLRLNRSGYRACCSEEEKGSAAELHCGVFGMMVNSSVREEDVVGEMNER
jgi:hypothetical protein